MSNRLEPAADAVIWRFLDLRKFRDLMASEELYFRRADLYPDESEGLPTEDYALRVLGLNPYDVRDRESLNNHLGSLVQHRESYYISCWHLYREETLDMWEQYGHDGVAVCSRYELVKAALDGFLDEAHLGLVRYGTDHLANRFNALSNSSPPSDRNTRQTERCGQSSSHTILWPAATGTSAWIIPCIPYLCL